MILPSDDSVSFGDLATLGVVVAIVAHPDDESFGLGAVLAGLAAAGADVRVICFTQGEASTLGPSVGLDLVRRDELHAAAAVLGVSRVRLAGYPDGGLGDVSPALLDAEIEADVAGASLIVVFEPSGVTGHPDHRAATVAAERVAARHRLSVLEWGVAPDVAAALNAEMGTRFVPFVGVDVPVDRPTQMAAIACHESQARDNPVLVRRLQLQGSLERVRLREAVAPTRRSVPGEIAPVAITTPRLATLGRPLGQGHPRRPAVASQP